LPRREAEEQTGGRKREHGRRRATLQQQTLASDIAIDTSAKTLMALLSGSQDTHITQ
jgi:hypothetical protein